MARTTGRKRFWFQLSREVTEVLESKNLNKNAQQLTN